jgi:hypothetical protein
MHFDRTVVARTATLLGATIIFGIITLVIFMVTVDGRNIGSSLTLGTGTAPLFGVAHLLQDYAQSRAPLRLEPTPVIRISSASSCTESGLTVGIICSTCGLAAVVVGSGEDSEAGMSFGSMRRPVVMGCSGSR